MNIKTIKAVTRFLKPLVNSTNWRYHKKIGQRAILLYHGISKPPRFNCITQSLFREQVSWLKENYIVVPLSTLVESLSSSNFPDRTNLVSITFDDGYINFAELALPILQEYNCHATVFVPSGKVASYNDWDEGINGFHRMEIMSYSTLRQLPKEFVEIGSHGISHLPLSHLSCNEIKKEIIESKIEIEQNLSRPIYFFAFPFGAYPFAYRFMLYDKENHLLGGYRAACTTWWGRYNSIKDINTLRRIRIFDCDSFTDFVDKMNGHYDWLEKKEEIGRRLKVMKGRSYQFDQSKQNKKWH